MRNVLWLCNFMLPMVAEKLGLEVTNKEGWVNGLATVLLASQQKEIRLSVAFPVERSLDGFHEKFSFADGAQRP